MATAATSSLNYSAEDMIQLALADVGVGGLGEPGDPDVFPHALKLLNLLRKRFDSLGALTWDIIRRTQTLTSGTAAYVLANDVSDIDEPARYTQSGATYGSQVTSMVRDEYMQLPDRTIQGTPYRYFAEKSMDTTGIEFITMYLYPVPPNTGDSLEYAAVIRGKDVTALDQTLDVPQKWLDCFRLGLAASLAIPSGAPVERASYLNKRFEDQLEMVLNDDNERGDIQVVPFGASYAYGQWGGGRYR